MVTDRDRVNALLTRVTTFLEEVGSPRRHHIVCGLRLRNDEVVLGLNIVSGLGSGSVCAEQVALGEALKRRGQIDLVISMRATFEPVEPFEVVPPCGRCRELLLEYAGNAGVVLPDSSGLGVFEVSALLPHPFFRRIHPVTQSIPLTQSTAACPARS